MAGGFAKSIRDLEFEIDQFTNRIELVRNHFPFFVNLILKKMLLCFVCDVLVVDLFRLFVKHSRRRT